MHQLLDRFRKRSKSRSHRSRTQVREMEVRVATARLMLTTHSPHLLPLLWMMRLRRPKRHQSSVLDSRNWAVVEPEVARLVRSWMSSLSMDSMAIRPVPGLTITGHVGSPIYFQKIYQTQGSSLTHIHLRFSSMIVRRKSMTTH